MNIIFRIVVIYMRARNFVLNTFFTSEQWKRCAKSSRYGIRHKAFLRRVKW